MYWSGGLRSLHQMEGRSRCRFDLHHCLQVRERLSSKTGQNCSSTSGCQATNGHSDGGIHEGCQCSANLVRTSFLNEIHYILQTNRKNSISMNGRIYEGSIIKWWTAIPPHHHYTVSSTLRTLAASSDEHCDSTASNPIKRPYATVTWKPWYLLFIYLLFFTTHSRVPDSSAFYQIIVIRIEANKNKTNTNKNE